jgi:hypothetical protein
VFLQAPMMVCEQAQAAHRGKTAFRVAEGMGDFPHAWTATPGRRPLRMAFGHRKSSGTPFGKTVFQPPGLEPFGPQSGHGLVR